MGDHHDLPFKAEYAKSGRSSCKACKSSIGQGSLRLAIMVQSPVFDGKIPNWFHYACFWKRAKVVTYGDIHGFDSLRWDDQEKIKEKVGGGGGGNGGGDATDGSSAEDFNTEYAKSGKSKCKGCEDFIAKGEVRISKKDYDSQRAKMYGPVDQWYHVDCFVENRDELEFGSSLGANQIKGFERLKEDDRAMLIEKLGKGAKVAKRKAESAKGSGGKKAKKEETEEEKHLKEQSKQLWTIRDDLEKSVSKQALKILLEINKQEVPSGDSKLLDAVADCMAFGALEKCPECKAGQLVYSGHGYKCTGSVTEWTKCMYITKTPKRKAFKVPKEYHDVDILKKHKYTKKERIFPSSTPSSSASLDVVDSGSNKPLEGMKFVIIGKTKKSKGDITREIMEMGGHITSKVGADTAACISTKEEVTKMSKGVKDAQNANVQVIDEGFLDAVKKGGAVLLIQSHSIVSWGSDPSSRISISGTKSVGKSMAKTLKDEKYFTKSVPSTLKMKVKGGAAVDPDSGLEDSAHIVQKNGDIYSVVLGLVDVVRGTNSFYKLQALEKDSGSGWWLFRAWGRVGTTIGGNKLERFGSVNTLLDAFKQLYAEKTGNEWENRKDFKKYPNKFYPLDIDYGQEDDDAVKKLDKTGSRSKLPKAVQDLVCLIFDVESMKKAMMEFEIDLKKMPLGKLSKKQITSAYGVLTELTNLMEKGGTETQFLDCTNRFYTLVPHDFGLKKPPILKSADVIKSKTEMLDNLLEIEVAYSLLKGGDAGEDPIDAHYKKLHTEMEPLDKNSEEFKRLNEYVKNTHAATHNQYDLNVEEIFRIEREDEAERFAPFKDLHNRQLLWHGSRTTNFAGILSQGLRIAPPEAPVTGYMFGKGIYFADMVSKSANYCRTSKADPTGVLLLCEVALGNMYERPHSDYIDKLPKGKHSCKGMGMTCPDPKGTYTTPDGVVIPMGKGSNSTCGHTSLLYNEFIVYDVAQVNMKYLLRVDFKYKW
ncbi:poly [ADP-ribose] polymerase 1-like [Ostrea edulis]|uniref:poly [ADP-ribose] polymerase 1-like n=1 Tax=Ostrea edulis TaxID=37623 RepID=UPI0020948479|nr:poly [ADP-ribose] polymerase 1-like [Ostrea edulis]